MGAGMMGGMMGGGQMMGMMGDMMSGALEAYHSDKMAEKAWHRQKKAMQHAVRWRVNDMKAAGINPILAVNPGAGAGGVGVGMARTPERKLSDSLRSGAQTDLATSQAQVNRAQAELLGAQKLKVGYEADIARSQAFKERTTKAGYELADQMIRGSSEDGGFLNWVKGMLRSGADEVNDWWDRNQKEADKRRRESTRPTFTIPGKK